MSKTIKVIHKDEAPVGTMGQAYLVSGKRQALRYWQEDPGEAKALVARAYETVGYVIQGRARLFMGEHSVMLEAGNAYLVPEGAEHRYEILESFEAIESTSPPAHLHDRDEPS